MRSIRTTVPAGVAKWKRPKVWDIWRCPKCGATFAPCTEDGRVLGHEYKDGIERTSSTRIRWCPGGKAENF